MQRERFVIATNNAGKLCELQELLSEFGISSISMTAAGISLNPEESGATFEENAYIKAKSVCLATGMPAIADDSGLVVDALSGAPGVHSARYGGEELTDAQRYMYLLRQMETVPEEERGAKFVSVLCCVFPNGDHILARGECFGHILFEPDGTGGFGYDPVFAEATTGRSFGRLTPAEKGKISHRGRALVVLREKLAQYFAHLERIAEESL
jgi:XTP/dITP diphosphohydrolase